jgi:hypothetical protein
VEIERDTAHLAIVKHQLPYLTRDLSLAPSPAGSSPAPEAAAEPDAADPRLHRLLSELSVSMDFFTREHPSTSIRHVFLLGEEALVATWSEWLSSRLRCPIESGRTFMDSYVRAGVPLTSAAGVGVIQATKDRQVRLNFLKRSTMSKAKSEASPLVSGLRLSLTGVQASVLATLIVGLLLSLWCYGALGVTTQRRQLARLVQSRPDVGWGLHTMAEKELEQLNAAAQARVTLLKHLIDGRLRVGVKMDALARALPEGLWLTGLVLEDRLEVNGKSQPRLIVNGACFLGESTRELQAIQSFEQRVKSHAALFQGFHMTQLDQMNAVVNAQQPTAHRTFQLTCNPAKERP